MPEEAQATDPVLLEQAEEFAVDIANLLNATMCDDAPIKAVVAQGGRILVGAYDDQYAHIPIPLQVDGVRHVDLKVHHQCRWDFTGAFLAVEESTISVLPARARDPLVRFHYERTRPWASAHLHVHAERDLMGFLLAGRHPSKSPTFRSLHLPVGGRRFRPSIEDIVEFVIEEFHVTTKQDWRDHVEQRRQKWREIQIAAAIRDLLRADPDRLHGDLHDVIDRAYEDVTRPSE